MAKCILKSNSCASSHYHCGCDVFESNGDYEKLWHCCKIDCSSDGFSQSALSKHFVARMRWERTLFFCTQECSVDKYTIVGMFSALMRPDVFVLVPNCILYGINLQKRMLHCSQICILRGTLLVTSIVVQKM